MFTFANFFRFLIIGKLLGLSIDPTIYKGKLDFSIIWPAIAAEKNCTLLWFVASQGGLAHLPGTLFVYILMYPPRGG